MALASITSAATICLAYTKFDADFSKQPEMIFKGSHMVYPTYDPRDHSLLITYYGSNGWDRIMLGTATKIDER